MAIAVEQSLLEAEALACVTDPLRFVKNAFPWQEPGTPLANETGPDTWQIEVLEAMREHIVHGTGSFRYAVASGHGVGKSALSAWIILFVLATRPHPQVVITANTKVQLDTKTWRELGRWHRLSAFAPWFTWTATKFYHTDHPATWFAAAIPWRQDRPEAFAGTHEKHVLVLFDEASSIDDIIWETAEGAMTTPGAMWLCFGNPTRNTGRFKECFPPGRFAHRWQTQQVDSQTCKMADKTQIEQWRVDYGPSGDFFKVRVLGQFPNAASTQFIGQDVIDLAMSREAGGSEAAPLVLGVDVARFGDDRTVLRLRQGPQLGDQWVYRDKDTMQVASLVAECIESHKPHATFIDVVGIGAGVYDRLKQLGYSVVPVSAGQRPDDPSRYANKRAEMWDHMRTWLCETGCVPLWERELAAELTAIEYGYDANGKLQLERKDDMKSRGLASPDLADALAMGFAQPVALPRVRDDETPRVVHYQAWGQRTGWMR